MDQKQYQNYIKQKAPDTNHLKTLTLAFVIGGLICVVGQAIGDIIILFNDTLTKNELSNIVVIIMIFIGALLTGIGVYDKLGAIAGAGSILPITGFANAVVAPAMEFNDEGVVFGIMAHLFAIAGPIIVSGVTASVLIGIIYMVLGIA